MSTYPFDVEPAPPPAEWSGSLLIATDREVLRVDPVRAVVDPIEGLGEGRPTCVVYDPVRGLWCGTRGHGVFHFEASAGVWRPAGLEDERVMSIAIGPPPTREVWVGTEPSALWRAGWLASAREEGWWRSDPTSLPSASEWAFPPRPETHHVRWIACDPSDPDRLWLAIEAGALVRTLDGGKSWRDREPGGPRDTHELAIHPDRPDRLHSAAGDGYYMSEDAGSSWSRPSEGLEVGYFRSIAVDPGDSGTVIMSGASGPRTAYVAGRSDGRLYRRHEAGKWEPVRRGWPDPPRTIAPLLTGGRERGSLWAADERGVHHTSDAGRSWYRVAEWSSRLDHLRGLTMIRRPNASF